LEKKIVWGQSVDEEILADCGI